MFILQATNYRVNRRKQLITIIIIIKISKPKKEFNVVGLNHAILSLEKNESRLGLTFFVA